MLHGLINQITFGKSSHFEAHHYEIFTTFLSPPSANQLARTESEQPLIVHKLTCGIWEWLPSRS
jgi:hypothetical protein